MILLKNIFLMFIVNYYIYVYILILVLAFLILNGNIFTLNNLSKFKYNNKLIWWTLYIFFLNMAGIPILINFLPKLIYISYIDNTTNLIIYTIINFIVFYFYLKNIFFLKYHKSFIFFKNINWSYHYLNIFILNFIFINTVFIGYYFNILFIFNVI